MVQRSVQDPFHYTARILKDPFNLDFTGLLLDFYWICNILIFSEYPLINCTPLNRRFSNTLEEIQKKKKKKKKVRHKWLCDVIIIIIIMGRMGICFTSVATSWWGQACCLLLCFPTGTCVFVLHLVPFWILTIWGSVHIEETVVGWRNQLRMKTSVT